MKKILTALSIVSVTYINAAFLIVEKPLYSPNETVKVTFKEMDNHNKDWVAIYPVDASTAWKNVIDWAWTENKSEGTLTFKKLPVGKYEVRAFYNNSYNAEATTPFMVKEKVIKAELSPTKRYFKKTEDVRINFKNINGATNDWLAIYPYGSSNDWKNVIKWKFNKGGVKAGQANFDKLPAGYYVAKVFYNNTFKEEASTDTFYVGGDFIKGKGVALSEGADPVGFYVGDSVSIDYGYEKNKNIPKKDWVAIYKKGDSTDFKNVIRWSWVVDLIHNGPDEGASRAFTELSKNLQNGEYEVRFFRNNSYKVDAMYPFTVSK